MTHPILSGRSECSNPPYQSTGSHGSTLLSADPYCVYRGHYLFFVDSNRGKFLKAPMLSIKYHQIHQYLMIPVLDVDLTSQLFVNRIVFQDKLGAPLENALPVIPLLMGVSEAQSFHVDSTMGYSLNPLLSSNSSFYIILETFLGLSTCLFSVAL